MKQLKRQDYKKFVEQHILRPFQGMISDQEKAIDFSLDWYNAIPLLVEDNEMNLLVAKTFLADTKVQLDIAVNGLQAIEKIKKTKKQN